MNSQDINKMSQFMKEMMMKRNTLSIYLNKDNNELMIECIKQKKSFYVQQCVKGKILVIESNFCAN